MAIVARTVRVPANAIPPNAVDVRPIGNSSLSMFEPSAYRSFSPAEPLPMVEVTLMEYAPDQKQEFLSPIFRPRLPELPLLPLLPLLFLAPLPRRRLSLVQRRNMISLLRPENNLRSFNARRPALLGSGGARQVSDLSLPTSPSLRPQGRNALRLLSAQIQNAPAPSRRTPQNASPPSRPAMGVVLGRASKSLFAGRSVGMGGGVAGGPK